jgi:hypothetical protein
MSEISHWFPLMKLQATQLSPSALADPWDGPPPTCQTPSFQSALYGSHFVPSYTSHGAPPRDSTNIPSIFSAGEYSTLAATWHLIFYFSWSLWPPHRRSSWRFLKMHLRVIMGCWCTHEHGDTKICSNCKFLQSCSFRFLAEISSACPYTYYKYYFFFPYKYIPLLFCFFYK